MNLFEMTYLIPKTNLQATSPKVSVYCYEGIAWYREYWYSD